MFSALQLAHDRLRKEIKEDLREQMSGIRKELAQVTDGYKELPRRSEFEMVVSSLRKDVVEAQSEIEGLDERVDAIERQKSTWPVSAVSVVSGLVVLATAEMGWLIKTLLSAHTGG